MSSIIHYCKREPTQQIVCNLLPSSCDGSIVSMKKNTPIAAFYKGEMKQGDGILLHIFDLGLAGFLRVLRFPPASKIEFLPISLSRLI